MVRSRLCVHTSAHVLRGLLATCASLVLLLLCASAAQAAISYQTCMTNSVTNAAALSLTMPSGTLQNDLLLLALHIAVPVGVVDLIGGGVPLAALAIFSVPFYDWASIVCAVWALLVLNRKSRAEE